MAYDFGDVTRESIEAGPRSIWRYRGLLPVPSTVEQHPNTDPGGTRQYDQPGVLIHSQVVRSHLAAGMLQPLPGWLTGLLMALESSGARPRV